MNPSIIAAAVCFASLLLMGRTCYKRGKRESRIKYDELLKQFKQAVRWEPLCLAERTAHTTTRNKLKQEQEKSRRLNNVLFFIKSASKDGVHELASALGKEIEFIRGEDDESHE